MRWYLFGERKPDYCKPIVVYMLNAAGEGHFVEGSFEPDDAFYAINGNKYKLEDNARWTDKARFVSFLDEYWPEV